MDVDLPKWSHAPWPSHGWEGRKWEGRGRGGAGAVWEREEEGGGEGGAGEVGAVGAGRRGGEGVIRLSHAWGPENLQNGDFRVFVLGST